MKRRKILPILFAAISLVVIFSSCEKNITIDLPTPEEKVVIEGSIEKNDYPTVVVTRNLPYFGTIDSTMIFNLFIQDAIVVVSDGVMHDTLKKIFNFDYYPQVYFKGTTIKGETGKTYTLSVTANGKTYTAEDHITEPVPVDSLWFKLEPHQDSLGYVWSHFTDPPESGNYYRLFSKRLTKDKTFVPMLFSSVFDDKFFNGQEFDFSIMRGTNSFYSDIEDPELGYFKLGDTIVVKGCAINKSFYDFWRSAEGEMYGGSNPFMNPSQIVSNLSNDGLGAWGGYGCVYDTVIAK